MRLVRRPILSKALGIRDVDADAERGRGLWLLRSCADDWGHYLLVNGLRATGGKEVWAEWHAPYSNE